jgi:DNA-binding response OmpR family regulator
MKGPILIVEDERHYARSIDGYSGSSGHSFISAKNAREGIQIYQSIFRKLSWLF